MDLENLRKPIIWPLFLLWFISIIVFFQSQSINYVIVQIAIITLVFSWFFLNRFLLTEVKVDIDVVIFGLIVIHFLDLQFIRFFKDSLQSHTLFVLLEIVHQVFIALQILSAGLLLTLNNKNRQWIITIYVFLGVIAHFFIYQEQVIIRFLFDAVLFFALLKRTGWIEALPKKTLGMYLVFFGICVILLFQNPLSKDVWLKEVGSYELWFSVPLYLNDFLRMYLLALSVRIPAVIIYNHLTLSRKLWFAGLFQSTIPQIFQFILLVLLFFFFVSGWQAYKLRDVLDTVKNTENNHWTSADKATLGAFEDEDISSTTGVWLNPSNNKYYYFHKDSVGNADCLTPLDSTFCRYLWQNTAHIFGNGVISYEYLLKPWQTSLLNLDVWQKNEPVKIYPFSFIPSKDHWYASYIEKKDQDIEGISFVLLHSALNFGKVFLPVFTGNDRGADYFAIDISLNYKKWAFSDPMVGTIIFLILFFILSNLFVIRQVIGAGEKINKAIISKFDRLKQGIREISEGNLDFKLHMEGEDEFVELAGRFNGMGERLQKTIEEAREKDRLNQELAIAREVQYSLLPEELPEIPSLQIAATLQTAQEVSGDFYDLVCLENGNYLFTIGDVSGKGTSAAFYMAQYISLFRYSAQFTDFPREIASRMNEYFARHLKDKQIFITAIIGLIDLENDCFTLVRAGHNNPIQITEDGEARELKLAGMGIGLTKSQELFKKSLRKKELELKKDEWLILYTDGLIEATKDMESGGQEMQYGEERLLELLTKNRHLSAGDLLQKILSDVNAFYQDQPKNDDLTLLLIKKG